MSFRVLIAHNAYQHRGGEDSVVESEIELLSSCGHDVRRFERHNDDIRTMGKIAAAKAAIWSADTVRDFSLLIHEFQPDLIHVHNTFPLISPSLYWAADKHRIPLIQTLHNFRLLCPQAMFLRNERVCEDCIGRVPWRGVVRACYRESMAQTAVLASMLMVHRVIGTYNNKVTRYIALNGFCRDKFVEGGLPKGKIVVKPNFVDMPAPDNAVPRERFLFVGRLSTEKGVDTLASALRLLPSAYMDVVGTGPEAGRLEASGQIRMHDFQGGDVVRSRMNAAIALLMPSIWYENFPRTLVEAFACGLPVIASRLGAMAALIEDGKTGLLFEPGNAQDLAAKMQWAEANPEAMRRMGEAARAEYEAKYTAEKNYQQLMTIYEDAIAEHKGR